MATPIVHLKNTVPLDKPVHPWIYAKHIRGTPAASPGCIVDVIDAHTRFIGRGYYNPHSNIRVRLITHTRESINTDFLCKRIRSALEKRHALWSITNAVRVVSGEADGLAGLIVDVYADTLVMQIAAAGMERLRTEIITALTTVFPQHSLYERSDTTGRGKEGLPPAHGWITSPRDTLIPMHEHGLSFTVNIATGHKTGFYLDIRKARNALRGMSRGKDVLDVCAYTGGFSIAALAGGARTVISVESNKKCCSQIFEHCACNSLATPEVLCADAFDALTVQLRKKNSFDIIVLDPPSFAKTRQQHQSAHAGYCTLNSLALRLIRPGGTLCTFSCSHHMPTQDFIQLIRHEAACLHKTLRIMKRCRQDIDHPIVPHIPETEYLKGYFLSVH